jgi:hypothetical protein
MDEKGTHWWPSIDTLVIILSLSRFTSLLAKFTNAISVKLH